MIQSFGTTGGVVQRSADEALTVGQGRGVADLARSGSSDEL